MTKSSKVKIVLMGIQRFDIVRIQNAQNTDNIILINAYQLVCKINFVMHSKRSMQHATTTSNQYFMLPIAKQVIECSHCQIESTGDSSLHAMTTKNFKIAIY